MKITLHSYNRGEYCIRQASALASQYDVCWCFPDQLVKSYPPFWILQRTFMHFPNRVSISHGASTTALPLSAVGCATAPRRTHCERQADQAPLTGGRLGRAALVAAGNERMAAEPGGQRFATRLHAVVVSGGAYRKDV